MTQAHAFLTAVLAAVSYKHWLPTLVLAGLPVEAWCDLPASSGQVLVTSIAIAAAAIMECAAGGNDLTSLGTICNELHAQSRQPRPVWESQFEGGCM